MSDALRRVGSSSGFKHRLDEPFIIGIAGGTASGKTTVCRKIINRLNEACVALIHQDSFYRGLTNDEVKNVQSYNFDHPDAFDNEALLECLSNLKAGRSVEVPVYDFTRHARSDEVRKVDPADVVIVEGILVLHVPELRDMLNMKIYVDTADDMRLARRIQRDVESRGRDMSDVIEQYIRFVKPAFDQFVAPSRRYADVIIPWHRGDNIVAIDLITEHIRTKLQQHSLKRLYPNLEVIASNYQIRGMHTIIRDVNTHKNDFVFYADRINRLVVEAGLGLLPFSEKTVLTPTGHAYVGVEFARKLCGVSIIRSGESMESALRTCCKGIKIGKILVVRHHGRPMSCTTSGFNTPFSCASPMMQSSTQQVATAGSPRQMAAAAAPLSPRGSAAVAAAAEDGSGSISTHPSAGASPATAAAAAKAASSRASSRGPQGLQSSGSHGGVLSPRYTASPLPPNPGGYSPLPGGSATPGGSGKPPAGHIAAPLGSRELSRDLGREYSASQLNRPQRSGDAFAAAAAAFGAMGVSSLDHPDDVIYEKLPADIAQRHVLLMDPVLSTGNSACRAIEVLLNRGVEEEKIFLLSIIAAPEGIQRVCNRFPAVRVVTSEIDDHIDDMFAVVPGCGEFGDRYFCD